MWVQIVYKVSKLKQEHIISKIWLTWRLRIDVNPVMHKLPSLYWLPKLHKTPIGSRLIAASSSCTTKPLSKVLTRCLSLVMEHFKQYNVGIQRRTHCNTFWVINNSAEALSLIRKFKRNRAPKHVDTFDFATLYPNIPHHLLTDSLRILIIEAYSVRGATYMCIGFDNIFWLNTQHRTYFNVSASKLVEYITFLVDNIFITAGDHVFKQTVGIPMGTDCAPLLANLFPFFYKYNYLKEKLKIVVLQYVSGNTLPDI